MAWGGGTDAITQQLPQTRSIGRLQPHANLHADGARAGGSTFFGAGAGAIGVCLPVLALVGVQPFLQPRGQQGRCVCHSMLTAAHPPVASQRHAMGKVPYPLGLAGVAPRRRHLQKCELLK